MKFILTSMLLSLVATSAFAASNCQGLADGYEDIAVSESSVTILGSEGDLVYNILGKEGTLLIARNAKLKSDLILDKREKSANMFIGSLTSYRASECVAKGKNLECKNRKKSIKISGKSVTVKSGTTTKKFEVSSNSDAQTVGIDLDSASHYSLNGVIAVKSASGVKVLDGRKFDYANCENN